MDASCFCALLGSAALALDDVRGSNNEEADLDDLSNALDAADAKGPPSKNAEPRIGFSTAGGGGGTIANDSNNEVDDEVRECKDMNELRWAVWSIKVEEMDEPLVSKKGTTGDEENGDSALEFEEAVDFVAGD